MFENSYQTQARFHSQPRVLIIRYFRLFLISKTKLERLNSMLFDVHIKNMQKTIGAKSKVAQF